MNTKDDTNDPQNIFKYALNLGNKAYIKQIISMMLSDAVSFNDIYNSIILCKEQLHNKHRELYIDFIKHISCLYMKFDFDIGKNNTPYYAYTSDKLENPEWPVILTKLENIKIINRILNSPEFLEDKIKVSNFDDLLMKFFKLSPRLLHNHIDLYNFNSAKDQLIAKYLNSNKSISFLLPWKGGAKIGEEGLLFDLVNKDLEWQTFDAENIKILIDYKWDIFGKQYLKFNLILHIALLICFTIYCFMFGCTKDSVNTYVNAIKCLFLLFSWLIALFNLCEEVIQFTRIFEYCEQETLGLKVLYCLKDWLYSKWNVFEFIMYASITFIIPIFQIQYYFQNSDNSVLTYNPMFKSCVSLTVCLIWWKLLYYFLPYKSTGPLIILIFEILKDIRFFVVVVIMILIGFGTMFFVLFSDEEESENAELDTYIKSIVTTFGMMLGQFESGYFVNTNVPAVSTVVLMLYLFIMMIVMINLLIAIMGDSFDRIKPMQELSFYVARYQIINDIENKMLKSKQKKIKYFH